MAGNPTNLEIGEQGGEVVLDATFRPFAGSGSVVDPDSTPTIRILDPDSVEVETGTATRTGLGTYIYTYSIAVDAAISDAWSIEWTAVIGGVGITSSEYFRVVAAGSIEFNPTTTVSIPDEWFGEVKAILAFPNVPEVLLTDEQIKIYAIKPALHAYFTKFPIEERVEYELAGGTHTEIDYPSSIVFGVTYANATGREGGSQGSSSGFWEIYGYNYAFSGYASRNGNYGTRYNFNGMRQANLAKRIENASLQNNLQTFKVFVNEKDRKIETYCSSSAKLVVNWACYSYDFQDVLHARQYEVIKLAKAKLLAHLADSAGIVDGNFEFDIDTDRLQSKAEDMEKEVLEKWNEEANVILLRS